MRAVYAGELLGHRHHRPALPGVVHLVQRRLLVVSSLVSVRRVPPRLRELRLWCVVVVVVRPVRRGLLLEHWSDVHRVHRGDIFGQPAAAVQAVRGKVHLLCGSNRVRA